MYCNIQNAGFLVILEFLEYPGILVNYFQAGKVREFEVFRDTRKYQGVYKGFTLQEYSRMYVATCFTHLLHYQMVPGLNLSGNQTETQDEQTREETFKVIRAWFGYETSQKSLGLLHQSHSGTLLY